MKIQKSVIFVKKNLKINIWKIKVRDHCHYTEEYRGASHRIGNLKYSKKKKISIVFDNKSNYDYHFIIKELAEKILKNYLFRRKYWKIHNLYGSNKKRGYQNW